MPFIAVLFTHCSRTKVWNYNCLRPNLEYQPEPNLLREDSYDVRETILTTSYADWRSRRYSKGTLHYLKKNARDHKPFKVYSRVRGRLRAYE
jgi:hypothetical protein